MVGIAGLAAEHLGQGVQQAFDTPPENGGPRAQPGEEGEGDGIGLSEQGAEQMGRLDELMMAPVRGILGRHQSLLCLLGESGCVHRSLISCRLDSCLLG